MTAIIIAAITVTAGLVGALLQRDPTAKRQVDVMLLELQLLRSMRENDAPDGAIRALEKAHLQRAERYAGPNVTPERRLTAARRRMLQTALVGLSGAVLLSLGLSGAPSINDTLEQVLLIGGGCLYAVSAVTTVASFASFRSAREAALASRQAERE